MELTKEEICESVIEETPEWELMLRKFTDSLKQDMQRSEQSKFLVGEDLSGSMIEKDLEEMGRSDMFEAAIRGREV